MRVLMVERFQKAMVADAATIFLWEQALHVSHTHSFTDSTAFGKTGVNQQENAKRSAAMGSVISPLFHLSGLSEGSSMNTFSGQ